MDVNPTCAKTEPNDEHTKMKVGVRKSGLLLVTVLLLSLFTRFGWRGGILASVATFFSLACNEIGEHSCPVPEPVNDNKYHPGQVWRYKTRAGEENSRVTILKVESLLKVGTIIHVSVDNTRLRNSVTRTASHNFQHMTFTKDSLERSVTELQKDNSEIPDLSGYEQWRADCGGVYTNTVAEAIEVAEFTFNTGIGPPGP